MALEKIGMSMLSRVGNATSRSSLTTKAASNVLKMRSQPVCDTFRRISEPTFDDIYKVIRLGNGRIRFIPKIQQVNGKNIIPLEMPEYLYHITSETNMKLIQSSNKLMRSANEQLPGVYLFDKENFLTRYLSVGDKKYNLCKSLLKHANVSNKNSSNLIVIKIPTENLARNGNIRLRTQEDFFNYQDKIIELQKGLKRKFSLRLLRDDKNRAQFEKYVLDNNFMTKTELDQFMNEMKEKIHYGYPVRHLGQLEKTKAIEYVYNQDICPDIIGGIQCRRFSINDCINPRTGTINIEKLRNLLS